MGLQADGKPNSEGGDFNRGSPKKIKPNKIPQRGLGIAALEKLRRDEQKMTVAYLSAAGEHFVPGVNFDLYFPPATDTNSPLFTPHSDPSDVSSPLFCNSTQNNIFLDSNSRYPLFLRKPPEIKPQVIKNVHSSPSSSLPYFQMEPPSNQSCININPLSTPEEHNFASLKRSRPFQTGTSHPSMTTLESHDSAPEFGNEKKRISLPRDDASSSHSPGINVRAEGGVAKLDVNLLNLGLLPIPESSSIQTYFFWKHDVQVEKSKEGKIAESVGPPTLFNFMGLPRELITESNLEDDESLK